MAAGRLLRGMTWDHARGYDPMVATAEGFAERHDGVRITWEKRSLQAFADRPIEAMAAEYDLLVIDHPHVGSAARSGLLLAFDDLPFDYDASAQLSLLAEESCGPSHVSYNFDGHQWGLAIDAAAPVAAYRPELVDTMPATWAEVVRLAEQSQVIWPLLPINALMSFFTLLANVGEPFGGGGRGVEPALGRSVLGEMSAVARLVPADCLGMDPIWAYEWLTCRSSHAYVPFLYGYSNYSRNGFRPHLARVADIPALGSHGPAGSAIGGTGIAVSASSRHPEIAVEYALWIASAVCQSGVYFEAGGQPASLAAWTDERCNAVSNDFFRDTIRTLERSYLRPRHDGYMEFQDVAGDLVHAYLTGQNTAESTVAAINAAYDRSLAA
jgi:multiple sugar transport system substrate-binding protein